MNKRGFSNESNEFSLYSYKVASVTRQTRYYDTKYEYNLYKSYIYISNELVMS